MSDRARADKIVQDHVLWSIGAGLVPLPVVDIVAVTAIQLDMLRQLARLHEVSFSESEGKAWVSALAGNMLARLGANALKLIPGIGSVIGGVSMAIVSGASTYALGQVASAHFTGGGVLSSMNMDAAKRAYAEHFEKGKKVAEGLRSEKKDVLDKLERLGKLRDKGVISDEEFEIQKKKLLDAL